MKTVKIGKYTVNVELNGDTIVITHKNGAELRIAEDNVKNLDQAVAVAKREKDDIIATVKNFEENYEKVLEEIKELEENRLEVEDLDSNHDNVYTIAKFYEENEKRIKELKESIGISPYETEEEFFENEERIYEEKYVNKLTIGIKGLD